MKGRRLLELRDSTSYFRFAQCCVGLAGCLCVCFAVPTPFWLNGKGLWANWTNNQSQQTINTQDILFNVLEAERVFAVISFLLAATTGLLCVLVAICWSYSTEQYYSNTQALHLAGQALYPTTLLLLTMISTGFFFLLSWSFFTYERQEEIRQHFSSLGSSYWLGAVGWTLLLVVESIVFVAEQAVVPDSSSDSTSATLLFRRSGDQSAAALVRNMSAP